MSTMFTVTAHVSIEFDKVIPKYELENAKKNKSFNEIAIMGETDDLGRRKKMVIGFSQELYIGHFSENQTQMYEAVCRSIRETFKRNRKYVAKVSDLEVTATMTNGGT